MVYLTVLQVEIKIKSKESISAKSKLEGEISFNIAPYIDSTNKEVSFTLQNALPNSKINLMISINKEGTFYQKGQYPEPMNNSRIEENSNETKVKDSDKSPATKGGDQST